MAQVWPAARTEAWRKLDWRKLAGLVEEHAREGDAIVATNDWTDRCLLYYLGSTSIALEPAGLSVVTLTADWPVRQASDQPAMAQGVRILTAAVSWTTPQCFRR